MLKCELDEDNCLKFISKASFPATKSNSFYVSSNRIYYIKSHLGDGFKVKTKIYKYFDKKGNLINSLQVSTH